MKMVDYSWLRELFPVGLESGPGKPLRFGQGVSDEEQQADEDPDGRGRVLGDVHVLSADVKTGWESITGTGDRRRKRLT